MADSIYNCEDGRVRVYVQNERRVMSYPKYLMERELGRPLEPNEEVHHKDENPLNNELSNLEIRLHGEHQSEHGIKYRDIMTTCRWCGKEFLWTARQQRTFYGNRRYENRLTSLPFCSRHCSGKYGRQKQLENGDSVRKFTEEQIRFIREHYVPGDEKYGSRALAAKFGVNKTSINLIIKGETYKNIL